MTVFKQLLNNVGTLTIGSGGYTPASTVLFLSPGGAAAVLAQATLEGVTVSASNPLRFVVASAASARLASSTYATFSIFSATGINTGTNQLTGVAAIENSSDRAYSEGDLIYFSDTSGALRDLATAVNALETGAFPLGQIYYKAAGGF